MNEHLINEHNKLVKPQDKVYYLGDVCMGTSIREQILYRLTGKKRLIAGNHDNLKNLEFTKHFDKIDIWRIFKDQGFTCSHIPLREDSFREKTHVNVHGHLHDNKVLDKFGKPDLNYVCVCVEQIDYTPIHMDEVIKIIKDRGL